MSFDPSYMRYDGLNSVNYTLRAIDDEPLFTRLLVDLPGPRNKTELKEHFMKQRQFYLDKLKQERTVTDKHNGR